MCTRVLLHNKDFSESPCLTARNMDWATRFNTNLWAFPAGVVRNSMPKGGFTWKSKYKSLMAGITANDPEGEELHIAVASDGINEKGLAVNSLWLAESDFGEAKKGDKELSMGIWVQYILDNYSSVQEVIEDWTINYYHIHTFPLPEGITPNPREEVAQHMSVSDQHGKSAILEYYCESGDTEIKLHITTNIKIQTHNSRIKVHYEEDCAVMTNSPVYEQQLKLNYHWKWLWENSENSREEKANEIAKLHFLPGTNRSPDRFARVYHYLNHLNFSNNYNKWIGQAFSLLRVAYVPLGYSLEKNKQDCSNTIWSTIADHKKKRYFFQSTISPTLIWVNLDELNLKDSNYLLYLPVNEKLQKPYEHAGNETKNMKKKRMDYFEFMLDNNMSKPHCVLEVSNEH